MTMQQVKRAVLFAEDELEVMQIVTESGHKISYETAIDLWMTVDR